MKNLLKGFVIGIGKIVPGVSGALLAILMGVYDKSIDYILTFRNNKRESIRYLMPIGIGIVIAIIVFSKLINYALSKYYFEVMMLFIGLIIGTIPTVANKIRKNDTYLIVISFFIFFLVSINNINNNYIIQNDYRDIFMFWLSGITEAIGTVVPGVSSSALLMIEGTYGIVIEMIGNITNIDVIIGNMGIVISFVVGLVVGLLITIKLIDYLLKKYNSKVYSIILGILFSSIILLIIQAFKYEITIIELLLGLVILILGLIISIIFKEE